LAGCRSAVASVALALALCGPLTSAAQRAGSAKAESAPKADPERQRQLQIEQRRLRQQLVRLRQQVTNAESSRAEAADALRESEAAISEANRRLRVLAADRRQVQQEIDSLAARSSVIGRRTVDEERALVAAVRSQFVLSRGNPWQRLIDGDTPGQLLREQAYLGYVARSHEQTVSDLRARSEELAELQAQSEVKQIELAALAEDEQRNRAELLRQQGERSRTLDRLGKQLGAQRRSLDSLQRDERRLTSLIGEIERLLAEESRRRSREARRSGPAAPRGSSSAAVEVPADGDFARLRGKLPLPVRGPVVARFGSPRPTEAQVDAPTWKGVFIGAAPGDDVLAVAAGRVVFADWLRGFGNLLIVDHGEGFLSVYGNNESLLAAVGDRIAGGDPVATVGSSGGIAEAGLYFELRYQGRPIDPLQWVQAR
jgi:septal ring factor EnvC (AmiA/AmiB activator)